MSRRNTRAGQAVAELALIMPVLLLIVFGIIEMSNAWRTYQVVTNVAREGARVAVIPTATLAQVNTRIQEGLAANALNDPDRVVIVDCAGVAGLCGGTGQEQRVRIEYPYAFSLLGPIVSWACGGSCTGNFGTITLASTTIMRKE